jgi:hypothetical protein
MKNLLLILLSCLCCNSCMFKGFDQAFELTVTVLDMDGKPVKDRKVKAIAGSPFNGTIGFGRITGTAITGLNGQAVLNYTLNISDSSQDYAVIATEDDSLFKCINILTHTLSNKEENTIKKTGTLKMDSLVPFKIRIKTNRDDVTGFEATINSNFNSGNVSELVNNTFTKINFTTTMPKVDTIISTKVYSKADFIIRTSMFFKNEAIGNSRTSVIKNYDNRNNTYLIEF